MYKAVIVDDEPAIVEGLASALDWSGYNFSIAYATSSSADALDYIKAHGDKIHLLITDVSMPSPDGIELLQKAKEMHPLLFVLMLSAYDNFEYVRAALKFGAENYLLKPLNPEELAESVGQIVRNMEKRSQLSAIYGTSLLSFRHNFTGSWVEGTLSPGELISKAEVLGLNIEAGGHRVLICALSQDNPARMSEFFDQLLSQIVGKFQGHFFFKTPVTLVSVLVPLPNTLQSAVGFIKDIAEQNSDIFFSLGPAVEHYSAVSESYQKAKALLFLQYTNISVADVCALEPPEDMCRLIANPFSYPDAKELKSALEQIFISQENYLKYAVYILQQLFALMHDQSNDILQNSAEIQAMLAKLPYGGSSRSDFIDYITEFVMLCQTVEHNTAQTMYPIVNAVIDIIKEQPQEEMSLKILAQKLNVSPSYLGSLFRQQTGYYFSDYLTQYRLEQAAALIRTTNLKMKDIVERTGFASQTYFNRIFKRNFAVSPVAYRRENTLESL